MGQARKCVIAESPDETVKNAVYLHSSWRAASTYVWAKFRHDADFYCYFEPLNEHLATATADLIDRFRPWSFAHHPPLEEPYLAEYRPLLAKEGGIPAFPSQLAYGRYCAAPAHALPDLDSYLDALATFADCRGRRPVYGFVRTDLRAGWFRAHRSGCHIFIRREPRRQFLSMLSQAKQGNPYFLLRPLAILKHNREEPVFASLLDVIDLGALLDSPGLRALLRGEFASDTPLATLYGLFYFMRTLARERGEACCDLVIDIDRMSLDSAYRYNIEAGVADLAGMKISFADCAVERYEAMLDRYGRFFDSFERDFERGKWAAFGRADNSSRAALH
ncbi:MAG TPA: hypothetical protein VG271_08960 [Beijerinckiaceae bacterium]|nr:hypothetical protein [Beijerinckiaceae bacterium]